MVQISCNKILAVSALVFASIGSVVADLEVTTPSAANWWVAQSQNLLAWTCQNTTIGNFTVLVSNTTPTILDAPLAIIAMQDNFDCSIIVGQSVGNLPAGSGYQVLLANPLNITDVYASSQQFEIKPIGSAYPTQVTSSAVGTASGTGGGASVATPTKASRAVSVRDAGGAVALLAAAIAAAVGVLA